MPVCYWKVLIILVHRSKGTCIPEPQAPASALGFAAWPVTCRTDLKPNASLLCVCNACLRARRRWRTARSLHRPWNHTRLAQARLGRAGGLGVCRQRAAAPSASAHRRRCGERGIAGARSGSVGGRGSGRGLGRARRTRRRRRRPGAACAARRRLRSTRTLRLSCAGRACSQRRAHA